MSEQGVYEQLAEQIGAGGSAIVPKIFETLANDTEARLLLAASPPATTEELAEKTGLNAADVGGLIDGLFLKGLLFKSRKPDATRYYRVRHLLQFHDATAVANDAPTELFQLWKQYMDTEWDGYTRQMESVLPGPIMRIIPINESLEPDARVLAFDDVRSLIDGARSIAVTRCSCRAIDGACGKALDVCIQLDKAADYAIERGTGRALTSDQAREILHECAEEGLVHVSENRRGSGTVICNCCSDCCVNWSSIRTGTGKLVAPSRFKAVVDEDGCNGCELCVPSCFFDALHLDNDADAVSVDDGKCMGCGVCRVACPMDAIGLEVARAEDFVPA